jgi:D-3-phosphoglycerate dehydrogenase
MPGAILVTDTLFIFDTHVQQLERAGYEVVRVQKPDMCEDELIDSLKGKVGYIIGGIEYVTEKVIASTSDLRAIVFTGTGFKEHIPGWKLAFDRGIRIGTTPYANVFEVAEWAIAATLAMQRDLFSLGPQGTTRFNTITSLPNLAVGVIGFGHIGKQYAHMIKALGAKEVIYWNRSAVESSYRAVSKETVFSESDIVFVAIGEEAQGAVSKRELACMKDNALLVSISGGGVVDEQSLSEAVKAGRIRAALDIVRYHDLFKEIPSRYWYGSNASAAYNSISFLNRSSDMAVETILSLLAEEKI